MNEKGFTLVELLAALIAGSLVLAGLSWAVAGLGRELRSSAAPRSSDAVAAVAPLLRALIEQAEPLRAGSVVVAEPDRLELTTAPPQALGEGDPVLARLSVRRGRGVAELSLAFAPASGATISSAPAAPRPLLTGFREIGFTYSGVDPANRHLPPRLVTIEAVAADGQVHRISASPRINGSAGCRFDPISMTCRS